MNAALISLAIEEAPAIIKLLQDRYAAAHPDLTPATDDQVVAAYRTGFLATVAKDETWKAGHAPRLTMTVEI